MGMGGDMDLLDKCPDCDKHYDVGDWPFPCGGLGHAPGPFYTGDAQLSDADKVVIYENPTTGTYHVPGRADRPINPKYEAAGYVVRRELSTVSDIKRFEKEKNLISEAVHYDRNSARAERDTNSV